MLRLSPLKQLALLVSSSTAAFWSSELKVSGKKDGLLEMLSYSLAAEDLESFQVFHIVNSIGIYIYLCAEAFFQFT